MGNSDLGGTMFQTAEQAKNYILDHDRYAKICNQLTVAQLRVMYAAKLRAKGYTVLVGGPAVMSKDELVNACVNEDYPLAAEARQVYYQSLGACAMFDHLTRDQLYALHTSLYRAHDRLYRKLIGPDYQPVIDPLSDKWAIISAAQDEITETASAVYAELDRRKQEASADA
jgi:hypothetical protein